VLFAAIKEAAQDKPAGTEVAKNIKGVTEETTTGVHRLYIMERRQLLFPAINVNDSVTKSKFDNLYGHAANRWSTASAAARRDDAARSRWWRASATSARARPPSLRQAGCRVMVSEVDPICALQAAMEGYEVTTMEDAAARADILSPHRNIDVITIEHMRAMKDRAIVCNIGHFDSEIQVGALKNFKWHNVKPQVDEVEFADGKPHHSSCPKAGW